MFAAINAKDVVWIAVSLALLMAAAGFALFLLKRLRSPGKNVDLAEKTTFTLDQIRILHHQGKISDDEFQRLKDKIITDSR